MSGTVLDSLVLEFGLDHRGFSKSQREVLDELRKFEDEAAKSGTRAEQGGKRVSDVMASFSRGAIGLLGLFLAGRDIKEFIGHVTNLDAQTSRLAKTMNMSASELSAWQGAMEQVGGSAESVTGTLKGITRDMNIFELTGEGVLVGLLSPLGIKMHDVNGELKTAGSLFLEMADAASKMKPAKADAFMSMIPGMNQDSINLMLEGRAAIDEMLDSQRALGGTTEWSAEQAKKYQSEIAKMNKASTNFGRTMLMFVAPAVTKAMNDITQAMKEGLNPHIGKGSVLDVMMSNKKYDVSIGGVKEMFGDLKDAWQNYDPDKESATDRLSAGLTARGAQDALKTVAGGPIGSGSTWDRFLKGLSYLETNQTNVGNATSSAKGYFQFIDGTADRARRVGLPDPRAGGYDEQAAATKAYIQKFHPDAASAIESGDIANASRILRGEWPSLPGGSQPQTPSRYSKWSSIVGGGSGDRSTTVTVGSVNVYTQATDAKGIAADIKPQLERSLFASQFNSGLD